MLETLMRWVEPIFLGIISALLAALLATVRKLPDWLLRLAANMQAEAKKTPGAGDDAFAAFAMLMAKAIAAAFKSKGSPVVVGGAPTADVVEATTSVDGGTIQARIPGISTPGASNSTQAGRVPPR